MNIKEIVKFPIQLVHVETISVKSEKKHELTQNEFNIMAETEGIVLDNNTGKSIITIKVSNEEYYIEVTKVGIFKFDNEIENEEEAKYFMESQGVRILWSYIREDIYSISSRMLSKPIMIPTIDVLKTLEKHNRNMKIRFQPRDESFYGIRELIEPVVKLASTNEKYVGILCEILFCFDSYSEHIVNDVEKMMNVFVFRIDKNNPKEIADYLTLKKLVVDFYWQIVNDDFEKKLKMYDQDLYKKHGFRYADNRLQRYRGLLLEQILIMLVKERFQMGEFVTGCRVYINRRRVMVRYGEGNSYHKETIDVAGWIEKVNYGEFYECKINPMRFANENYKYFMELISQLRENKVVNYIVGFVSADATEKLKAQKKLLEEDDETCKEEFALIGREDLYRVKFYNVPEIA